MINKMICIAGKSNIAIECLRFVLKRFRLEEVCFIPNSDDSGLDGWDQSFKKYALKKGVKQVSLEEIYAVEKLIFFSLEFSELISVDKFSSSNLFNIHFSLLPKYKGVFTSAWPLLNGEKKSGVTLHIIDSGIDTGDVIAQIEFDIDIGDTAKDLYLKYTKNGVSLFKENFSRVLVGNFQPLQQSVVYSSYYSRKSIDYKNSKPNFYKTSFEVHNYFRAMTFREYQLPKFFGWDIYMSEIMTQKSNLTPGRIKEENEKFFIVSTIDFDIKLFKDYYGLFWSHCSSGDIDNIRSCILHIPQINLRNNNGWNGIILATYNGHFQIVEELLKNGADVSSKNYNGTTLLMYALSYYRKSKDSKLFTFIAGLCNNYNDVDVYGKSIYEYLSDHNCKELLQFLS